MKTFAAALAAATLLAAPALGQNSGPVGGTQQNEPGTGGTSNQACKATLVARTVQPLRQMTPATLIRLPMLLTAPPPRPQTTARCLGFRATSPNRLKSRSKR